jgi:pilus assembly protein Flp/PilA
MLPRADNDLYHLSRRQVLFPPPLLRPSAAPLNPFFREVSKMLSIFRHLMRNEKGATAIEYTLIASLIAVAAITAMGAVGTKVNGVLSNVASAMN